MVHPQQIVLVIGATDVGKSTFCRFLIERGVTSKLRVGFVDADVGQSQIVTADLDWVENLFVKRFDGTP